MIARQGNKNSTCGCAGGVYAGPTCAAGKFKAFEAKDKAKDKKAGIKEGSGKDTKIDAKAMGKGKSKTKKC